VNELPEYIYAIDDVVVDDDEEDPNPDYIHAANEHGILAAKPARALGTEPKAILHVSLTYVDIASVPSITTNFIA
jgi:hypothetical protein